MRITERRLRQIIRNVIKETSSGMEQDIDLSMLSGLIDPEAIAHAEEILSTESIQEMFSKKNMKQALGPLVASVVVFSVLIGGAIQGRNQYKKDNAAFDRAQNQAASIINKMSGGPYSPMTPEKAIQVFDSLDGKTQGQVIDSVNACMQGGKYLPRGHMRSGVRRLAYNDGGSNRIFIPKLNYQLKRETCLDFYHTFMDPGAPHQLDTSRAVDVDYDSL